MPTATIIANTRLRPAAVLAALGLVSGILSAWFGATFEPAWLKQLGHVFFVEGSMVPIGVFYGVALVAGAWLVTGLRTVPVLLLTTLYAWSAAIYTATGVITTSNNDVRLILGSLAAGAVGAGLTHLGCALLFAELRDLRRMAVTIAIGALVALLYYAGERDIVDIRWLFVIWQPAVAACIGAGLRSPSPA
jgi:hypothetical protein